jgi:hypothetical protein
MIIKTECQYVPAEETATGKPEKNVEKPHKGRVDTQTTEVLTGGERCTERARPYTEITHGKL